MAEARLREDWRHTCAVVSSWGGKLKNPYEEPGGRGSGRPMLSPKESVNVLIAVAGLG